MIELRRSRLFIGVLIAITAIGPTAMQMFLPALPAIQRDFGASPAIVQLTLSLSMVSIAVSTLILGPLSDQHGRRPVMIAAMGLYLVGTGLCWLSPDVWVLILGRIVQAAGGAAGMVLGRAIVRDVYDRESVASVIAYLTMAMVVAPMVAPAVGGLLTDFVGWRATFIFLGVAGVAVTAFVVPVLVETNLRPLPLPGVGATAASFVRLLRSPIFCGYVFQGAFSSGSFFAFLSGAPYVMVNVLGRPATEYGLYFILLSLAFMAGNFVAARASARRGIHRMLVVGSALALSGTLFSLFLALTFEWGPLMIFGPAIIVAAANGMTMPNAQAGAVSHHPDAAGTASGLSGFLQMMIASVFAQAVGTLQDGTPYPMIGFMIVASSLALISIVVPLLMGRK